jgi:geranylgeranyl pyrophosphate synthase
MILEDRGFKRVALADLLSEMESHGTLEKTRDLALRYCEAARARLSGFADSAARRSLLGACDFITARSY